VLFDWGEVLGRAGARVRICCKDYPLLAEARRDSSLIDDAAINMTCGGRRRPGYVVGCAGFLIQ